MNRYVLESGSVNRFHGMMVITGIVIPDQDIDPDACRRLASQVMDFELTANPKILLPPYFAIESSKDPWLPINMMIYREMCSLGGTPDVYFPLAIGREILGDGKELQAICGMASDIDAPGFAIWPVGFDEFHSTAQELKGLAHLLGSLTGNKILLYAGYFSILLCAITGASFSNGPCFFEKRDIGISPPLEFRPRCRYYFPLVHQKVDPVAAVVLYDNLHYRGIRPKLCEACRRNIFDEGYEGIAGMPDIDIFEHNFINRRSEVDRFRASRDPIKLGLEDLRSIKTIEDDLSRFRSMKYISTWFEALENLIPESRNRY